MNPNANYALTINFVFIVFFALLGTYGESTSSEFSWDAVKVLTGGLVGQGVGRAAKSN